MIYSLRKEQKEIICDSETKCYLFVIVKQNVTYYLSLKSVANIALTACLFIKLKTKGKRPLGQLTQHVFS